MREYKRGFDRGAQQINQHNSGNKRSAACNEGPERRKDNMMDYPRALGPTNGELLTNLGVCATVRGSLGMR